MNSPLVTALAAALFHFLWQGLVIAMALAACRNVSPQTRYRLACVAFFAMPAAFFTTLFVFLPDAGTRFSVTSNTSALLAGASMSGGGTSGATLFGLMQTATRRFVPFWLAGMVFFYVRNLGSLLALQRLQRTGTSAAPAFWQQRVQRLAGEMGIASAVTLLESVLVDVPVVAGFLRPVILFPASLLTALPASQLEYLLIHELAHIRRYDYALNLLQKAVEGLLFYHPAVWWISDVLRREREHCCDDVVLARCPDAMEYAATLVALEQGRPDLALAANGTGLASRIRRILNKPAQPRAAGAPLHLAALATVLVAVTFVAFEVPHPLVAQNSPQTATSPWQKWLIEDVAYIIEARERDAYTALQTDEERRMFIEQFWGRRHPDMKPEHYRRIAYANQHYGAAALPGWKTDRGRIYIIYGPPDEIDSHPSGDASGPPWEDWRYRLIQGIGQNVTMTFRDTGRNGHFEMTKDPANGDAPLRNFRK